MSIYKGKIKISNTVNELIGFDNVDLNDITYIRSDNIELPSGRTSSKLNYCCMLCNKDCKFKIGNRCKMLEKNIVCPQAVEVNTTGFRKNSKNDELFKHALEKMRYLLTFGELSAWAYENKSKTDIKFTASDIDVFESCENTKFENFTNSDRTKKQIMDDIERTRKYNKYSYSVRNNHSIFLLNEIFECYSNYFSQYADLCSSAVFMTAEQKELYKLQAGTVGLDFENIDDYVHHVNGYYLFSSTFNTYIRDNEHIIKVSEYIHAKRIGINAGYSTVYIKDNEILEAAESLKHDRSSLSNCYYRQAEQMLLIRIVNHLAGIEE